MGPKQSFEIIFQLCLPFLRLDGYYLVSDLTGVPDLFGHLRPALRSLVPGRQLDPDIGRLRPGVRLAVTVWALGTLAFVGWFGSVLVGGIPLLLETAWSLISSLGSATGLNLRQGRVASAGVT